MITGNLSPPRALLGGNLFGYSCDAAATEKVLDTAEEFELRAIDTADVYTDGNSERFIGSWLRHSAKREDWFIATKTGTRSRIDAEGLGTYAAMRSRLEASIERLDCDYVDLLQLHHQDSSTPITETAEGARRLKDAGLIRSFGVSNVSADVLQTYSVSDVIDQIDYVQVYGNWLKPNELKRLVQSRCADFPRILVYGVLGRGVLTGKYLPSTSLDSEVLEERASLSAAVKYDSEDEDLKRLLSSVAGIARHYDVSLTEIAIRYIVANGGIPIVGCRTPKQVRALADAMTQVDDLWLNDIDSESLRFRTTHGQVSASLGEPFPKRSAK